jgi:hypothetical protein
LEPSPRLLKLLLGEAVNWDGAWVLGWIRRETLGAAGRDRGRGMSEDYTHKWKVNMRVPSPEEVDRARTPKGGWTRKQLAVWNVPWPPPHDWKKDLERAWTKQEMAADLTAKLEASIVQPVEKNAAKWKQGA